MGEQSPGRGRRVILYELNEVPWSILDRYVERRPSSALAKLARAARSETTINRDHHGLQPWRTWPTFHTGLYCDEHNSFELGQDPETIYGTTIWQAAEDAGLRIGLFGVLQSWPAHQPRHGGFYVPDTFARSSETYPKALERFQSFNLSMTRENAFSATSPLNARRAALTGLDILVRGLTPWAAAKLVRHVLRERRDERWKAARPMAQVLPAFDLYWRLHRRFRPHLSIFFTNHVAGMMHRYWGDAIPEYTEEHDYRPDDVFGHFVFEAMDLADHQLAKVVGYVDRNPDSILMIASSMGQEAIPYDEVAELYVVRDAERLMAALGFPDAEAGLAMYPRTSVKLPDEGRTREAKAVLEELRVEGDELFHQFHLEGTTVSWGVHAQPTGGARVTRAGSDWSLDELGLTVEERLGGGNTAYHIPEGILMTYGPGIEPAPAREEVEVTEIAPRILDLLAVARRPVAEPA